MNAKGFLSFILILGATLASSQLFAQGYCCPQNQQCVSPGLSCIKPQIERYEEKYGRHRGIASDMVWRGGNGLPHTYSDYQTQADSYSCADASCEREAKDQTYGGYKFQKTRVFGEDSRILPEAELTEQEEKHFSGIGLITCDVDGVHWSATAFFVGRTDVLVTAAHAFHNKEPEKIAKPGDCKFRLSDRFGNLVEEKRILKFNSRWEQEGDTARNHDMAVVKLDSLAQTPSEVLGVEKFDGTKEMKAMVVGYHHDVPNPSAKRKTFGTVYDKRPTDVGGTTPNLYIHDIDTNGAASGAPVINVSTGKIIGLHIGASTAPGTPESDVFNRSNNVNEFLGFDNYLVNAVKNMLSE
jgi:V8-like Glu-specific endopeptidase